jgi:transcriptional regulator of acetoin/glycerol metabolism
VTRQADQARQRWRDRRDGWQERRAAMFSDRRDLVVAAWRETGWRVSTIAREMGISRETVYADLHAAGAIDSSLCKCAACQNWALPPDVREQWPT